MIAARPRSHWVASAARLVRPRSVPPIQLLTADAYVAFGLLSNLIVALILVQIAGRAATGRVVRQPGRGVTPVVASPAHSQVEGGNTQMATITSRASPAARVSSCCSPVLGHVAWLLAAAVVGFGTSALFSGVLRLPRPWFVGVYLMIASGFLHAYVRCCTIDLQQLFRSHWLRALIGAAIVGAFMAWSMQRQAASPRPDGIGLALALAWLGLVYGVVDALLLTVMPVVATWRAFEGLGWTGTMHGRISSASAGLLASLAVTAAYHLGFAEFRGPELGAPLFGNGLFTVGYLLTGNPITAVGAHIMLHVASVLHGIDTTVTLPPHY